MFSFPDDITRTFLSKPGKNILSTCNSEELMYWNTFPEFIAILKAFAANMANGTNQVHRSALLRH